MKYIINTVLCNQKDIEIEAASPVSAIKKAIAQYGNLSEENQLNMKIKNAEQLDGYFYRDVYIAKKKDNNPSKFMLYGVVV